MFQQSITTHSFLTKTIYSIERICPVALAQANVIHSFLANMIDSKENAC